MERQDFTSGCNAAAGSIENREWKFPIYASSSSANINDIPAFGNNYYSFAWTYWQNTCDIKIKEKDYN